jgi:hypothetical protein
LFFIPIARWPGEMEKQLDTVLSVIVNYNSIWHAWVHYN